MRKHLQQHAAEWTLVGLLGVATGFATLGNLLLDMRGKLQNQTIKAQADSTAMASQIKDLKGEVKELWSLHGQDRRSIVQLDTRVSSYHPAQRLEVRVVQTPAARDSSFAAHQKEPGLVQSVGRGFGWLWRGLKAAFPKPAWRDST